MPETGQLYPLGVYASDNGRVRLIGLALHSETSEVYAVIERGKDFYVEPLSYFGDPNVNGKPRYEFKCFDVPKLKAAPGIEPGTYKHFKRTGVDDPVYQVYGTVKYEGDVFVLYRPCYGQRPLMIRPFSMFHEHVDKPEFNYSGPRFFKTSS